MSRFSDSPGPQADLDEIWDYVAVTNENPTAANRKRRSTPAPRYSTVTLFARFRGRSTLQPRSNATW